jgi:hypothetical protein
MRPILSSTESYNYALAKWLEEKLKPLSLNQYTICDTFRFAKEIRNKPVLDTDVLVSYDVTSLFTNVPVNETITVLVDKAFQNNWFNLTYDLNLTRNQLTQLLKLASTNQLFQFDGHLYEQCEGVAMGSPLGPLLANVFMCHLEDKITNEDLMPSFYRRYVDDTLVIMPDVDIANSFLGILNSLHPNIDFTMELSSNNSIPFIGMVIKKEGNALETQVYHKPTDTGLLLHYQSHTDNRYKHCLLKTMLHRAKELSSTNESFVNECNHLRSTFTQLGYPTTLINSTINSYLNDFATNQSIDPQAKVDDTTLRINIPFKDQVSANAVKKQLKDLSTKIDIKLEPVFTSRKLERDLKHQEQKLTTNHKSTLRCLPF